jgi:hypothetical protein
MKTGPKFRRPCLGEAKGLRPPTHRVDADGNARDSLTITCISNTSGVGQPALSRHDSL